MKRGITILAAAALTFTMAGPVMAQAYINHHAVMNTDSYLNDHPDVA